MAVVKLAPSATESGLAVGFVVPRQTTLRSQVIRSQNAVCEFRTAHDVTLWPLEIEAVEVTAAPPDIPLARLALGAPVRGAIRLRLAGPPEIPIASLPLERLTFFLSGADEIASRLYELVFTRALGVVVGGPRASQLHAVVPPGAIRPEGFGEAQAMLPYPSSTFGGYRLLHEYFAFPSRYLFFTVDGLGPAIAKCPGNAIEIVVLLDQAAPDLERVVDEKQVALYCTPAVNLFPKRADRINVGPQRFEYHVVADRAAPLDYEVYAVTGVVGHATGMGEDRVFRPFYRTLDRDGGDFGAYWSARREPRMLSDTARRNGTRSAYVGSEVFLSLVDQAEAPFSGDLRQLSIDTLCTNRDLPLLMRVGGGSDFALTISAPVDQVRVVRGLSRPTPAVAERELAWRLISHLGLNYLALTDVDAETVAKALRETLELYAVHGDASMRAQIDGVKHVRVSPVTRRLPHPGPLAFGRGVRVALAVDETRFAGFSPHLLATVLEQFFARHVAINTFTETTLASLQRGTIASWAPRIGRRAVA
jgi:type VI secretion system protein ImpG